METLLDNSFHDVYSRKSKRSLKTVHRKLSIRLDANTLSLSSPLLSRKGCDYNLKFIIRRFNENAHTYTHRVARTRSHANEGNMQSGFDRIANATRVHTYIRAQRGTVVSLFEHPLLKSCQRPLNHSFRSLIVNVPR